MADEKGQSPETREWVKRRQAADEAIAHVRRRTDAEDVLKRRDAENRVNENPMLFIVGLICAAVVIIGGLWWFITAVQCDPLISDRAFSSACR